MADDGLFLKSCKHLDRKSNVPVVGAWLSAIPIATITFFLSFEALIMFTSIAVLLSYSVANLSAIVFRMREDYMAPVEDEKYAWTYFVVGLCFLMCYSNEANWYVTVGFGVLTLLCGVKLHLIP